MTRTARLDAELVRRGLARSRGRAAALVAQGRVNVAGEPARKPSQPVEDDTSLDVVESADDRYVSRAAHKLAAALDAIGRLLPGAVTVEGARCLDAGASTGGFTQVLLERGAAHILAVDVGHGQIAAVVAADPRVEVREGTNVRALAVADIGVPVDLVVADLSFISLTTVLPALLPLVHPRGHLLIMVKPQFEVGRERLGSSGVVGSVELRREAVLRVATAARELGAVVRAVVPSTLPGPAGNREYFLWLTAPADGRAVEDVMPADTVSDVVLADVVLADVVGTAVLKDVPVLVSDAGRRP
jgi:23S rRNA (cytidine1920-2'-O)/16S rRNA (cytidine1409-2'-O)-methyltransferase